MVKQTSRAKGLLWGTHYRPGRRIPEAMHSKTRRKASPGPSGRLQVAMAFSQINSRGCSRRQLNSYSDLITKFKINKKTFWPASAAKVTHPSFDRLPLWPSVAHVSENPHDDDAGLEIYDSGLKKHEACGAPQTDSSPHIWTKRRPKLGFFQCMLLF